MKDYIKNILKLILGVFLIPLMANCSTIKEIPTETHHIFKDSTIIKIKDSIRIIPIEKVINVTLPNQISELETSLATSKAYTDTLGFLHHHLENKKLTSISTHQEVIETVKTDSIFIEKPIPYSVIKEIPVIPKFYKFTFWWFIFTILTIFLYFFLKFYKK